MLIRRMTESDIDAVLDLMQRNDDGILAEFHSAEVLAEFRAEMTPQDEREHMVRNQVFVVEEEGQVVATGALADLGTSREPRYIVSQFAVRPDRHRRGIGTLLLAHLVSGALDVHTDTLHVPSSRNAIPFYEHAGFTIDALQPDTAIEITWMTKRLCGRPA